MFNAVVHGILIPGHVSALVGDGDGVAGSGTQGTK